MPLCHCDGQHRGSRARQRRVGVAPLLPDRRALRRDRARRDGREPHSRVGAAAQRLGHRELAPALARRRAPRSHPAESCDAPSRRSQRLGLGQLLEGEDLTDRRRPLAEASGRHHLLELAAERRRLGETTTIGTGLVQACAAGHLPLVQWLLPRAPGLLEMADGRGATPLVYACEQGHAEIAEWLLEQGAAPGDEAAQAAAEAGLADLAKELKAAKAAAAAAGGE